MPLPDQQISKFNFRDVSVIIDGNPISGFGEDPIKCSKMEDNFEATVGNAGDIVKNVHNNPLGEITVPLLATSASRPVLDAIANDPDSFHSIFVISKNQPYESNGGSKASIRKQPDREYGQDVNTREYVFEVYDYMTVAQ